MRRSIRFVGVLVCSSLATGGCKKGDSGTEESQGEGPDTTASPVTTGTPEDTDPTGAQETGGVDPIACPYEAVEGQRGVELELVASGFDRPVLVVGHPTEPDRLFVVEQGGSCICSRPA